MTEPYMQVTVKHEAGYEYALEGLSYNKKQPVENMLKVADKLAGRGLGHDKFMRQVVVWLSIRAPRYWWQEFDAYKVGITTQSESTMFTLGRDCLTYDECRDNLEEPSSAHIHALLLHAKRHREENSRETLVALKSILPEGWLQRRMVCTNYGALSTIYKQRKNHKLPHWQLFLSQLQSQLQFPDWLSPKGKE